jgi:antitoxin HigA-1
MAKKPLHPGELLRKQCLESRGLTVTDAAQQIGITRQTLNNILNGKSGISSRMAVPLAQFFGLRPETLQQWQKTTNLAKRDPGERVLVGQEAIHSRQAVTTSSHGQTLSTQGTHCRNLSGP